MEKIKSYLFMIVPFVFFIIAILVPMITGIYSSFTNWNGNTNPYDADVVGLQNFKDAFKINKHAFGNSILFTIKIAVALVFFINLFGFTMAYLVTRPFKGTMFFRGAFFIPNIIGGLVVGYIWEFIFRTVFNQLHLGSNWLQSGDSGFWALIIVSVWQSAGYMMVIYIAAIQNIPKDIIEASKIDNAPFYKKVLKIYLPYLMPAFTVITFLSIRYSFGLFDQVLSLTGGGPNYKTQTIAMNIYNIMFTYKSGVFLRIGQAQGVIYFLLVSAIAILQVKITKKGEING